VEFVNGWVEAFEVFDVLPALEVVVEVFMAFEGCCVIAVSSGAMLAQAEFAASGRSLHRGPPDPDQCTRQWSPSKTARWFFVGACVGR
jgi:hypothetical protein